VLRGLRQHSFLRTNQFQVEDRLRGLDERLRVHSRDRLADALQESLDRLAACSNNFTPDALHFLLELSDQPVQKSRLADLESLGQTEKKSGQQLTWAEIAREDGWADDRLLWRNVSFEDSSDEEPDGVESTEDSADNDDDATESSLGSQRWRALQELITKPGQPSLLQQVKADQGWLHDSRPSEEQKGEANSVFLSEMQIIREALFMLGGLPTTVFRPDCAAKPIYMIKNVPEMASKSLLNAFTSCGRQLQPLRRFVASRQDLILNRALQDAIRRRLNVMDRGLAAVQAKYISSDKDVVVSLLDTVEVVYSLAGPLHRLAELITNSFDGSDAHKEPFRYLELLFEGAENAQAIGSEADYKLFGNIFFECFDFYVRPLRTWMEEGRLTDKDETFFISENQEQAALHRLWEDQYRLVHKTDGTLNAPSFLRPAVMRIFATGKSVVALRKLGSFGAEQRSRPAGEPLLTFDAVCCADMDFAPFTELFQQSFEQWVHSKHHTVSKTLHNALFTTCGLAASLEALQQVYFMSNGASSSAFSRAVFGLMDDLEPLWRDQVTLTNLAREAWVHLPEADRLTAYADANASRLGDAAARASVRLGLSAVHVDYRLSWPILLVVDERSLHGYRSAFSLLLQFSRAEHCLQTRKILTDVDRWDDSLRHLWLVRSKLLWFTSTLRSYLTFEVLEPAVHQLRADLSNALDVDEMIEVHSAFMKKTLEAACLSPKLDPIRECFLDILDLAIRLQQEWVAVEAHKRAISLSGNENTADGRQIGIEPVFNKAYGGVVREIRNDFERHLRFICSGLRGIARATSNAASAKWDVLAEMLEDGQAERAR
jgi:gamma-tubulin complex component 5